MAMIGRCTHTLEDTVLSCDGKVENSDVPIINGGISNVEESIDVDITADTVFSCNENVENVGGSMTGNDLSNVKESFDAGGKRKHILEDSVFSSIENVENGGSPKTGSDFSNVKENFHAGTVFLLNENVVTGDGLITDCDFSKVKEKFNAVDSESTQSQNTCTKTKCMTSADYHNEENYIGDVGDDNQTEFGYGNSVDSEPTQSQNTGTRSEGMTSADHHNEQNCIGDVGDDNQKEFGYGNSDTAKFDQLTDKRRLVASKNQLSNVGRRNHDETSDEDDNHEDFDDELRDPSYEQPFSEAESDTSSHSIEDTNISANDNDDRSLNFRLVDSESTQNQNTGTRTEGMASADHHNEENCICDVGDDNQTEFGYGNSAAAKSDQLMEKKRLVAFKHQLANVTVPLYSRKEDGKRDYRKINYCLYCERSFTSKISDHYLNIHVKEERVKAVRMMEIGTPQRRKGLMELENRGNFRHNVKAIEKGIGELVVARRPHVRNSANYRAEKFLPCEYCLGFYFQESLWLHMSSCKFRPLTEQPSNNYVRDAKTMLTPFLKDVTEEDVGLDNLFSGMKETSANPGIPRTCQNDKLIREFAKSQMHRLGEEDEQRIKDVDNMRTKVRTVGRLLHELNSEKEINLPLTEYITPKNFFTIVNATKSLSLKTNSPQIALVLGHYIKQITLLKISLGIMNNCEQEQNEGRDFQILYQAHWNNRISCVAKRRQRLRQLNKSPEIPLTEDLVTLKNFVKVELEKSIKIQSPDDQTWKKTAQLTLVRIDLFNKRRIAEVQELKVSDYLSAGMNDETDENILNSLDMFDKILSTRMKIVEVKGKSVRSLRPVSIVLAPDMIDALEYLLRTRCSNSPFMFCRKSEKTPLDGCEAMRDVTKMCPDLKYPERIRSRKIRKYLATTCQLLDMTDSELKLVADHMGHNLNVHTDVYRLQSSLLEKTKVARVLIAMENGCVGSFKGKTIQDIPLESIPEPIFHDDAWTTEDILSTNPAETAEASEAMVTEALEEGIAKTLTSTERSETDDSDSDIGNGGLKRRKACSNEKIKRVRWDEEENSLFRKEMQPFINTKTMPPRHRIHDLARLLQNRTVAQIRTKIHNIISGKLKTF